MIKVNMTKAKEIHRENLRKLREPLFTPLDTAFMKALEAGDAAAQAEIAAKKQALRDVTKAPGIEAAQTPEELKAVVPDVLKG